MSDMEVHTIEGIIMYKGMCDDKVPIVHVPCLIPNPN